MNRYATFFAVAALTTGFVATRTGGDFTPEQPPSASMQKIRLTTEQVQEMLASYRVFKGTLEATIHSLRQGEIRLKEAHAQVHSAATRHYPKYLGWLAICESGSTSTERLARNLVEHVRAIEEVCPTTPSPLPTLERELCEFLASIEE